MKHKGFTGFFVHFRLVRFLEQRAKNRVATTRKSVQINLATRFFRVVGQGLFMAAKFLLTDIQVKALKPKEKLYRVKDGGGLFAVVLPKGSKRFEFRYSYQGRETRFTCGARPVDGSPRFSEEFGACGGYVERI